MLEPTVEEIKEFIDAHGALPASGQCWDVGCPCHFDQERIALERKELAKEIAGALARLHPR